MLVVRSFACSRSEAGKTRNCFPRIETSFLVLVQFASLRVGDFRERNYWDSNKVLLKILIKFGIFRRIKT